MKTKSAFYRLFLVGLLFTLICNCKKEAVKVIPTVTIEAVTNIANNSASSGGMVTSDGGSTVIECGICWNTSENPTTADSKTSDVVSSEVYYSSLSGLTANTTYYVRAYATNSIGTGYANQISFTTSGPLIISKPVYNPNLSYGTVSDIDGNVYKTIQIGTQIWMADNLKTTKLNDGTSIPLVTAPVRLTDQFIAWNFMDSPAYCWYDNNEVSNKAAYGALYNWYAVNTGKLAPVGWHVPNTLDLQKMQDFLGGNKLAAEKLKEKGPNHWITSAFANNESGFTALPGGSRIHQGVYRTIGNLGDWWTSERWQFSTTNARAFEMNDSKELFWVYPENNCGLSVRCVKD